MCSKKSSIIMLLVLFEMYPLETWIYVQLIY